MILANGVCGKFTAAGAPSGTSRSSVFNGLLESGTAIWPIEGQGVFPHSVPLIRPHHPRRRADGILTWPTSDPVPAMGIEQGHHAGVETRSRAKGATKRRQTKYRPGSRPNQPAGTRPALCPTYRGKQSIPRAFPACLAALTAAPCWCKKQLDRRGGFHRGSAKTSRRSEGRLAREAASVAVVAPRYADPSFCLHVWD